MIPFLHLLLVVSEVYDPAICRTGHMHTQIAFNGVSCLNTTQKKMPSFFSSPFFFPSLFSFFFFLPPLCNLFVCSIVCTIGQCSYDGALLLWCVSHKILTRTRIHNFCSFLSYPILKLGCNCTRKVCYLPRGIERVWPRSRMWWRVLRRRLCPVQRRWTCPGCRYASVSRRSIRISNTFYINRLTFLCSPQMLLYL